MDYEEAELSAGVKELGERWGFYLAYKAMAGDSILSIDDVSQKSVYEVYAFLLCSRDQSLYEKRLFEIIKNKK